MSKKIEKLLFDVLTDAWCPEDLAKDASKILSKHYPDNTLIGATEAEVKTVKQAQEYVRGNNG